MNRLEIAQTAGCEVVRAAKPVVTPTSLRGRVRIEHWRDGEKINEFEVNNGLTNEGKAKLLNVGFHNTTQIATWFTGLVDNANFTAEAATDTYAQINGANQWKEFTNYTDANNADNTLTRPEWPEGAASGAPPSMTNSSAMIYNITANGTVHGVLVAGGGTAANTKNDAAGGGTLWATADFSSSVSVQNGDQLKVTYTITS
jgi:hypothetical protein